MHKLSFKFKFCGTIENMISLLGKYFKNFHYYFLCNFVSPGLIYYKMLLNYERNHEKFYVFLA